MAGELILVVDDNDKNRKLVRDLLQFRGYRTIGVGRIGAEGRRAGGARY
jgi:CheY-like chemotaxis protein